MDFTQLLVRFRQLQDYVDWTADDAQRVRALRPILEHRLDGIIDDFYATIERHAATRKVIEGGAEQVDRLKVRLREWIEQLLEGEYDESYVAKRWRVGWRHVEIGLAQHYTMVSLARVRSGLARLVCEHWTGQASELHASLNALHRALDLDLVLIEDAYQFEYLQRQKRSDRLVAIGQMAAGIAHELRNPLNVIRTSVFYLQNVRNPSEEKRTEHMQRIQRQITVADTVIAALSDFARLPLPDFRPVDVPTLLDETIDNTPLPDLIRVDRTAAREPHHVLGDRRQLFVVFGNLLRNAAEAMPGGGKVHLTSVRHGDVVEVTVQDTGPGIMPDHLSQIFEPFFSTKVRGMGLGLAITKAIVENHGGNLSATSTVGRGACFVVRLQAVEVPADVSPDPSMNQLSGPTSPTPP